MTALQAINRLYEEFQKEIYDAPADEATVSYLLDRLSEAKELVIDEYNLEQSSKKIIITATLAIVSVVNFLHFLSTYNFVQLLQLSIFLSTYPADASFLLWFSFIFFSSIALFSSFSFSSFIIRYILRTIFSTFLTSLCVPCIFLDIPCNISYSFLTGCWHTQVLKKGDLKYGKYQYII